MDPLIPRRNAFEPVSRAFSDAWLQIRAKPGVYLLVWLTLVLVPYLLLDMAFSNPVDKALAELMQASETVVENAEGVPPEMMEPILRLSGYYGIIWLLVALTGIYNGAVLSGTVSQFREKVLPTFVQALSDGRSRYIGFLKAVVVAAAKILWKPLAALIGGVLLGVATKQPIFTSVGFFAGVIFLFSGLYRFGLGPFIHLSLGLSGAEACALSREFYFHHRPVVSSLFLVAVLVPSVLVLLLFSLLVNIGIYLGAGSIILWFIQSIVQFTVMIALVNFAMNTFTMVSDEEIPAST